MNQNVERTRLELLTDTDLEAVTGGEEESVYVSCTRENDNGSWACPGFGDLGQFL